MTLTSGPGRLSLEFDVHHAGESESIFRRVYDHDSHDSHTEGVSIRGRNVLTCLYDNHWYSLLGPVLAPRQFPFSEGYNI